MYLVLEQVELNEYITAEYGKGLTIAPKGDAEVGSADNWVVWVVVERNMTDVWNETKDNGKQV